MKSDLLGAAAPGFDAPLAVLEACHARIARLCSTLEALLPHLAQHGADTDARHAATAIVRYFDTAAVQHHDDEERNLFPLLEAAQAGGACDLVETLTLEHDELGVLWRRLRPGLVHIAAGEAAALNPAASGEAAALNPALIARFIALNREHLAFENEHMLPLAARILSASDLERLGRAMAARRGVAYPDP